MRQELEMQIKALQNETIRLKHLLEQTIKQQISQQLFSLKLSFSHSSQKPPVATDTDPEQAKYFQQMIHQLQTDNDQMAQIINKIQQDN